MKGGGEKVLLNAIAFDKGNLILGIVSMLVGALLGVALPPLVQEPKNISYWPQYILILVSIILVVGVGAFIILGTHQKEVATKALEAVNQQLEKIELSNSTILHLVDQTVARQATLIARSEIYREMAESFNEAKSSISVVTLLAMDWEKGVRNWTPAMTSTPGRDAYYNAVKRAIIRSDVCYERIWQVPQGKGMEGMAGIMSDPLLKEEYELIEQNRKLYPHLAKFMLAPIITTASFILVDGKELFLNIDLINEKTGEMESPYMLFIKDASGEAFEPMKGVIARFKAIEL